MRVPIIHDNEKDTVDSSERNRRIYEFLISQPVGVLATVDPNGNPHAAVIYFSIDRDFNVTFMTKQGTRKSDNLERNDHAMLVVYEAVSQTTAQITGVAQKVSDAATTQAIFSHMLLAAKETSSSSVPPIAKLDAGQYIAYHLEPMQIRMATFTHPNPGGYDMYETIDFSS